MRVGYLYTCLQSQYYYYYYYYYYYHYYLYYCYYFNYDGNVQLSRVFLKLILDTAPNHKWHNCHLLQLLQPSYFFAKQFVLLYLIYYDYFITIGIYYLYSAKYIRR